MALPPRLNEFREIHALTTGIDATSGDKVLADAADIAADKILTVRATVCSSDDPQDFELKASGGQVLARYHLAAKGSAAENGGGLAPLACPAGEGLTVNFANAAINCIFSTAIELVDVP